MSQTVHLRLDIPGWMSEDELRWLHETAATMRSVAEIGCWKGRSTHALASACAGPVYAVDHWLGSIEEIDTYHQEAATADIYAEFLHHVGHFTNLQHLRMHSQAAVQYVPAVDMVFLDASHAHADVAADIAAWHPRARRLICGHDYDLSGVRQAVDEHFDTGVAIAVGSIWTVQLNMEVSS